MSSTVRAIDRVLDVVDDAPARQVGGRLGVPAAIAEPAERFRGVKRATVEELRAELTTGRFATTRAVVPGLAELFPGGGLRRGSSYIVPGSSALALALLAGPSQAGAWCGAIGMPDLGGEAAAGLGVDLGRLVLVPRPGPQWPAVVGTLADALDVVVVQPVSAARDSEVRRLSARLRERGATLLVTGGFAGIWPGAELRLEITSSTWHGLGAGFGHLASREVTISATGRTTGGRPRTTTIWLPDREGKVRTSERLAESEAVLELAEHRLRRVG